MKIADLFDETETLEDKLWRVKEDLKFQTEQEIAERIMADVIAIAPRPEQLQLRQYFGTLSGLEWKALIMSTSFRRAVLNGQIRHLYDVRDFGLRNLRRLQEKGESSDEAAVTAPQS